MKLKITLLCALGLITNVAFAGNSAKIGYASDFFYRGEQKALESVQSSVDVGTSLLGLDAALHACTNQSVDSGVDSYGFSALLGTSVIKDLLSVYGGFTHFEDVAGEALSELKVEASFSLIASPTISISRNVDEDWFTFEGSVSHSLNLDFATLGLKGSVGNTETSDTNDRTYYGVGASLSKSVGDNADLGFSLDLVDSDDIEREFVFGTALSFNF